MREVLRRGALAAAAALAGAGSARGASFVDPMRHEMVPVTPRSFNSLINKYRNAEGVAVVLHYRSDRGRDRGVINGVYNDVAKELKGMVRMTALDCAADAEAERLCAEHDAKSRERNNPVAIVFPPSPLPAVVVENAATADGAAELKRRALAFIPGGNVATVTAAAADQFLKRDAAIPKVLFFGSKEKPSVLVKALSNAFKDRMYFGFVTPGEAALAKRFRVATRPAVVLLSASGRQAAPTPELYKRASFKYADLYEWLNVKAETFVKGGGFSDGSGGGAAGSQITDSEISRPWLTQLTPEVTGPSHQDLCFRDGSALCAMLLTCGPAGEADLALLKELHDNFAAAPQRGAALKFMWLDACMEPAWREALLLSSDSPAAYPDFVVVNPHKRLRFVKHDVEANGPLTLKTASELLDRIVAGTSFTRVKNNKGPTCAVRNSAAKEAAAAAGKAAAGAREEL